MIAGRANYKTGRRLEGVAPEPKNFELTELPDWNDRMLNHRLQLMDMHILR